MVSTFASYQLITRDIGRSLTRVENQPVVARETEYYRENIGKVTSIDEFVSDTRLFRYAMKAHGLSDMTYAKAFMVKVLEGGIKDSDAFANKLTDKRYQDFARTYNFAADGAGATTYSAAQQGTATRYQLQAAVAGVAFDNPILKAQTEDYLARIKDVKSIDAFLADDALFSYAMKAYGLTDRLDDKAFMRQILEGGVADPDSLANRQSNTAYAEFAAAFDFAAHGENATTYTAAKDGAVAKYARQTLEEEAGSQNEGVRLALYFERKAATITSPYQILADQALATVMRTVLGLPDSIATADIDRQAEMFSERIDFADFQDAEGLHKFLTRFTTMWEMNNGQTTAASLTPVLFGQPVEFGISTDVLLTLQSLRR
ncbi:MAG: DUF1217 domain-containing protein [Rhizobiaceae bacterium]|nr:DUF1217 domain-containing protein [Rhizobiaceae bacterium]